MNEAELIERCEKRDMFAAAALQGILANRAIDIDELFEFEIKLDVLIERAYYIAEFMVQEKDKRYHIDENELLDK